jgi:hypothetical protein
MFDEDIRNLDWYLPIIRNNDSAEYLYEMYPNEAQIIKGYAKEAVDMVDYRQSFIYDEYPDRLMFYQMVERVYTKYMIAAKNRIFKGHKEYEIKCIEKCMKEMTQIIVANEIYNKRSRRR